MNIPDYAFQLSAARQLSRESNVRLRVIGESRCKRKIICLKIGKSAEMPLIAAGFHGMEYLTVLCALRFANEYAAKKPNQGLLIVPCVNPDGTEIALHGAKSACRYEKFVRNTGDEKRWQANARGVDINHNFDADWENVKRRETETGITRPAATRFGGFCPESEPETKALTKLCRRESISRVLALHSQGREIYWDFGKHTPKSCLSLAEKMSEISGYKVASPEPIAAGGGFKDWFIEKLHRCGFTVEIGKGKNPLPLRDFETEYPVVRKILRVFTAEG